ncbi:hypothetical protein [Nocardia sp. XZ_19_385]|uniref:hypothetical protein n=1 Tax=Nocardia sp. XZ_19_385 TaxID=2769488 RepID=UPI00188E8C70|nr:hypothetical protein [Nocardia sp. XZ_19_385]
MGMTMRPLGHGYLRLDTGPGTGSKLLTVLLGRTEQNLVLEVSDARAAQSVTGLEFNQRVATLSRRYARLRDSGGTVTTWCELAIARSIALPNWGIS